jgi:glycine cleavage system aminomethyltransferase T
MAEKSLEAILQKTNPVKLLRNSAIGPYVYPVVPSEYTNWRDEQHAWQKTCLLFNQSYHMTDMYVEGPDGPKLLEKLGVNTFKNFTPNKAKQYIPCTPEGYVIGDVILFHLEQNLFNLVGRPSVHNWVQYNCETGGYNAKCTRDERAAAQKGPIVRKTYRYQVQGPTAPKVMEKVLGGPVPDVKFFNMTTFKIAGKTVSALRHGMVGQPGFELFGPAADGEAVKAAIVEAGQEFDCGCRARAPIRQTRSNQAGFRHRFRQSIPARK